MKVRGGYGHGDHGSVSLEPLVGLEFPNSGDARASHAMPSLIMISGIDAITLKASISVVRHHSRNLMMDFFLFDLDEKLVYELNKIFHKSSQLLQYK